VFHGRNFWKFRQEVQNWGGKQAPGVAFSSVEGWLTLPGGRRGGHMISTSLGEFRRISVLGLGLGGWP